MDNDELHRSLGRIEGQLSVLPAIHELLKSHGKRIGALERWRTGIAGGIAVVIVGLKLFFGSKS